MCICITRSRGKVCVCCRLRGWGLSWKVKGTIRSGLAHDDDGSEHVTQQKQLPSANPLHSHMIAVSEDSQNASDHQVQAPLKGSGKHPKNSENIAPGAGIQTAGGSEKASKGRLPVPVLRTFTRRKSRQPLSPVQLNNECVTADSNPAQGATVAFNTIEASVENKTNQPSEAGTCLTQQSSTSTQDAVTVVNDSCSSHVHKMCYNQSGSSNSLDTHLSDSPRAPLIICSTHDSTENPMCAVPTSSDCLPPIGSQQQAGSKEQPSIDVPRAGVTDPAANTADMLPEPHTPAAAANIPAVLGSWSSGDSDVEVHNAEWGSPASSRDSTTPVSTPHDIADSIHVAEGGHMPFGTSAAASTATALPPLMLPAASNVDVPASIVGSVPASTSFRTAGPSRDQTAFLNTEIPVAGDRQSACSTAQTQSQPSSCSTKSNPAEALPIASIPLLTVAQIQHIVASESTESSDQLCSEFAEGILVYQRTWNSMPVRLWQMVMLPGTDRHSLGYISTNLLVAHPNITCILGAAFHPQHIPGSYTPDSTQQVPGSPQHASACSKAPAETHSAGTHTEVASTASIHGHTGSDASKQQPSIWVLEESFADCNLHTKLLQPAGPLSWPQVLHTACEVTKAVLCLSGPCKYISCCSAQYHGPAAVRGRLSGVDVHDEPDCSSQTGEGTGQPSCPTHACPVITPEDIWMEPAVTKVSVVPCLLSQLQPHKYECTTREQDVAADCSEVIKDKHWTCKHLL